MDNHWYFFDPYGIYSDPSCYPTGVNQSITTSCARYPISWKNGKPDYPAAPQSLLADQPIFSDDVVTNIAIAPNPSMGDVRVTYKCDNAGKIILTVYDKTGIAVFNKADYAVKGDNSYPLNLRNLIPGVYYLEVNNNGIKDRGKFLINK